MKIKCMLDNYEFKAKPTGKETAYIQNRLKGVTIGLEELFAKISNGATHKPAYLNKENEFVSQQLFELDIENGLTIDETIKLLDELNINYCGIYKSFSHTESSHRFRVLFCVNNAITDLEERNKIQLTLMSLVKGTDEKCKDYNRLFYGTNKEFAYINTNSYLDVDKLMDNHFTNEIGIKVNEMMSKKTNDNTATAKTNKRITINKNKKTNRSSNSHIEAISNLDVKRMKLLIFQAKQREDYDPTVKEKHIFYSISGVKTPPLGGQGGNAVGSDTPVVQLSSINEVYEYINEIDLGLYLNVNSDGTLFNCILPGHDDRTPSANIYKTNSGTPVYKCFGCDQCFTIIGITEKLAKCSRKQAIEFIKKVYNIEYVESDWVKDQKLSMMDNVYYLESEEFRIQFPTLSSIIRNRKFHYQSLIVYFIQFVNDGMKDQEKMIFYSGYDNLMKVCGLSDRKNFAKTLALFALLGLLEKVDEEDIPKKDLKKAKSIAATHNHQKLTGFYYFPELGVNTLEMGEVYARILKANNFTLKGLSREYVLRTFGVEVANRIYPQYKYENSLGTTEKSNKVTDNIVKVIFDSIDKKGYILEKNIPILYKKRFKGKTKKQVEIQLKRSINEILDGYDLKRVRLNKELKEKFGVTSEKGYPFLIAKNDG